MSGQISRTGLRDTRAAKSDIVQVAWRPPRQRSRVAFASHRPPSRASHRIAANVGEMAALMAVMLLLSGIVAGIAYAIVQMWMN